MARRFYRFDANSALGKQFRSIWNECKKAERAAEVFAKKVGAETYYSNPSAFAGGVACVSFKDTANVNKKLWRSLGKDADGYEQWEPAVSCRSGIMVLPCSDQRPADTVTRIYDRRVFEDKEGRPSVKYVELYRDDYQKEGLRSKMPYYVRESIRIERARMTLPVVSVDRIYRLLQADQSATAKSGKPTMVQDTAPTFFQYGNRIFVGCDYPCCADDIQEIGREVYVQAKEMLLRAQRDLEALAKSVAKGS